MFLIDLSAKAWRSIKNSKYKIKIDVTCGWWEESPNVKLLYIYSEVK